MAEDVQLPPGYNLIKEYYEKVIQLVRYNKAKDEIIERLGKENERYRADFCQWVYKPLAMSLIGMRENCKRELSGMACRDYTADRLRRNFSLLAEELDGIIIDNGGEIAENDVLYDGRSVLKPYNSAAACAPEQQEAAAEEVTTTTAEEAAATETEAEDVKAVVPEAPALDKLLEDYQRQITSILADNAVIENALKGALAYSVKIDAENKFMLVYPVFKDIYLCSVTLRKQYGWLYEDTAEISDGQRGVYDDPAALKDMYMQALSEVIEKLLAILEKLGVTTLNCIDDKFDPACQQIAKTIAADEEEKDRRVANYVTDGYLFGSKLIYRQKVDIYKFKR